MGRPERIVEILDDSEISHRSENFHRAPLPVIKRYLCCIFNTILAYTCNIRQKNLCGGASKTSGVRTCAGIKIGPNFVRDRAVKIRTGLQPKAEKGKGVKQRRKQS